jgi:hypothetical protein
MRIIMKAPDGSLRIIVPAREMTAGEHIARAKEADPTMAKCEHVETVEAADLPQDRTFRDDGKLDVDMPLAREIHKKRLRAMRAPLLTAADVEMLRAIETGDDAKRAEVATRKQALRDATSDPSIEAAETPEELKAAIPRSLKGAG